MDCKSQTDLSFDNLGMQLHPFYDINNCEWVVEIDGKEVSVNSLRELQQQFPAAEICDYYPDGYPVVRENFLVPTGGYMRYIPQYSFNMRKREAEMARIKESRKIEMQELGYMDKEDHAEIEIAPSVVCAAPPPNKLPICYESVMELRSKGHHITTIAYKLECSVSFVQMSIMNGLKKNDPRAKAKKYEIPRNSVKWSDEEDKLLRELATIYTAKEISCHMKRSRNSIIGRCQRLGVKLPGTNHKRQRPSPPMGLDQISA